MSLEIRIDYQKHQGSVIMSIENLKPEEITLLSAWIDDGIKNTMFPDNEAKSRMMDLRREMENNIYTHNQKAGGIQ